MCDASIPTTHPNTVRFPELMLRLTRQIEEMNLDLEEQRELATKRLQELEDLHRKHKDVLKQVEKLKMDVSTEYGTGWWKSGLLDYAQQAVSLHFTVETS